LKKVGLIGYGYWGKILHQKLKHLSDVKFICTSKDDYHSKLEDVDWVFVVTTNQSHYQIVKDCILAGKNVFCEKPLTPTYKKSLELCELAKQHNVKLFIDEVFWYRSELIDIHHLFSHRPKELKCTWEKYGRSDYRNYVPASFHNLMYHDLYLLQIYLKDKELKSIDVIDKTNRLHFKAKFDDVEVEFLYDRKDKNKDTHSISGIDLKRSSEDALAKMIKQVLEGSVCFEYNQDRALFASQMIDEFKKRIYKSVNVVGAGIFGCTTAWKLSQEGYNVNLFEKNNDIINSASYINQYRLHRGYHYPRSKETAEQSQWGEASFIKEYGDAIINGDVEHYYCIAKEDSLVNPKQYWTFLNEMNLPYKEKELDFIHKNVVSLTVQVKEFLFDPNKLKKICWDRLNKYNVNVVLNNNYDVFDLDDDCVINTTYANLNQLLPLDKQKDYQFELCEKPVIKLPKQYKNKSVVIMDGPFMCIDPLGDTGLHIMGNVVHAIHSTNVGKFPEYDSKFDKLLNKGIVKNPSITNIDKFIESAKKFFVDIDKVKHIGSMFTFRTVLPNRDRDDARPTLVENPTDNIFNIFSGKIGTCVNAADEVSEYI
tara:strand:+ start:981 stop:2768 length:1788 start_codon:yes stop_codon:yes gene_type:complete